MQLKINTGAAVIFTNKLEKLHRSALPSAIREALNDAAYDLKKKTMLDKAANTFEKREPGFFKANSRAEAATGFNVNSMKSTVGFINEKLKGKTNYAIKDLKEQEEGGNINAKSFIPMDDARVSGSFKKKVRANARLSEIKFIKQNEQKGKNNAERFVQAALIAGVGGLVLGYTKKRKGILWRVNSLVSDRSTKKFTPKLTALYDYSKSRSVHVNSTHFMKIATINSGKKLEAFYIAQAQRQIKKFE